jgi:hypothetical protein
MIDTAELKRGADLLRLLKDDGVRLRRVANTAGGEYAAASPFCGGSKRLKVQPHRPEGGRWFCRHCTGDPASGGRWRDALDYVRRRDGCDFRTAARTVQGYSGGIHVGHAPATSGRPATLHAKPTQAFRRDAEEIVHRCEQLLWSPAGVVALEYLCGPRRGLSEATLRHWRLGWSPGARIAGRYVPPGVVIPSVADGAVWRLKVRLLDGRWFRCQRCRERIAVTGLCPHCGQDNRYRSVAGGVEASLFGLASLPGRDVAVLCEGEFNALTLWQACADLAGVVSVGSAKGALDLSAWDRYLLPVSRWYAMFDPDAPGERAAARWSNLSARVTRLAVPRLRESDKDISDYQAAGGDVRAWFLASTGGSRPGSAPRQHASVAPKLTVVWPAGAKVPTVRGHWRRLGTGEIEAAYTREELALCLGAVGALSGSETAAALVAPVTIGSPDGAGWAGR